MPRHKVRCPKCSKWMKRNGGYCLACRAAYMRQWRKTHPMNAEQKRHDICRSYAHVYLRRGKIQRKPCEVCGSDFAEMHHPDYDKPLEIEWLCRRCHRSRAHADQMRNPALPL